MHSRRWACTKTRHAIGVLWWAIDNRPATLVVDPTPADASVRIEDQSGQGRMEVQRSPGPVQVTVEAPGHHSSSITVHLEPGSEVRLTPRLLPRGAR